MVFAIAQEYGCSLDASNGQSNEHQENRITGPCYAGYDGYDLIHLEFVIIDTGITGSQVHWTFFKELI